MRSRPPLQIASQFCLFEKVGKARSYNQPSSTTRKFSTPVNPAFAHDRGTFCLIERPPNFVMLRKGYITSHYVCVVPQWSLCPRGYQLETHLGTNGFSSSQFIYHYVIPCGCLVKWKMPVPIGLSINMQHDVEGK